MDIAAGPQQFCLATEVLHDILGSSAQGFALKCVSIGCDTEGIADHFYGVINFS